MNYRHLRLHPNLVASFDAVLLLPMVLVGLFYIRYAFQGWFFQDDFTLLATYHDHLLWHELVDFSNFGRFLSRNVYWYLGVRLFGTEASSYFIFNFLLIALNAGLIYLLVVERHGLRCALVAASIYFCLPATIHAYAWIANAQHLLGHTCVFWFLLRYRRVDAAQMRRGQTVELLFIFALGLISNVFAGLVISWPWLETLRNTEARRQPLHWLLLAICSFSLLYFVHRLHQGPDSAYATQLNWPTLAKNADFYFFSLTVFALWLVACVAGACWHVRQGAWFEAWMFLASILFFLPFAFLQHQRYAQYMVLSQTLFWVALWVTVTSLAQPRGVFWHSACVAFVALLMTWSCRDALQYFSDHPWGAEQRALVQQLQQLDAQSATVIHRYCFLPTRPLDNRTGVALWSIPVEWWQVGFGQAFTLFVSSAKSYAMGPAATGCEATLRIDGGRLMPVSP